MRTFGKLRELIKRKYGTLGAFADALGVSRSTLSIKLNGKSGWKSSEVEEICNLLGIQMESVAEYFFYG